MLEAQNIYMEDETLLKIVGISRPLCTMTDRELIVKEIAFFLAGINLDSAFKELVDEICKFLMLISVKRV